MGGDGIIGIIFWWWTFDQLGAPDWLWALLIVSGFCKAFSVGYDFYKDIHR